MMNFDDNQSLNTIKFCTELQTVQYNVKYITYSSTMYSMYILIVLYTKFFVC